MVYKSLLDAKYIIWLYFQFFYPTISEPIFSSSANCLNCNPGLCSPFATPGEGPELSLCFLQCMRSEQAASYHLTGRNFPGWT